jgi:flagellar basal-body rod protein FlgF
MDNGIYITLSRQLALFRDMDVTANNVANANTTGFSSEHVLFNKYLVNDVNQKITNPMAFPNDVATYRDTQNGALQTTGNPLDVAINGHAYFAVETPNGTRYTRAGNFQVDGEGNLITPAGYPVLDFSNQHITFPDNVKSVEIGSIGNIKVNGDDFGVLGVFQFSNEQMLEKAGNNLYKSDIAPDAATGITVTQGTVESSNVQPVMELTHMIQVSRAVDQTSQYIGAVYDMERKASNTWAQQG